MQRFPPQIKGRGEKGLLEVQAFLQTSPTPDYELKNQGAVVRRLPPTFIRPAELERSEFDASRQRRNKLAVINIACEECRGAGEQGMMPIDID